MSLSSRRFAFLVALSLLLADSLAGQTFKEGQQRYPRVRKAREATRLARDSLYARASLANSTDRIFMRVFKHERTLELWITKSDSTRSQLVAMYPFTSYSGTLGPKRAQGDLQIPEGCYYVDRFNPSSRFHLSLGLNYPNKSDRLRKSGNDPGGDIFIHGGNVTIGCMPLGDSNIEQLYIMAVDARSAAQRRIPVHIFPCRMDKAENKRLLERYVKKRPELGPFWDELRPIYDQFEENRVVPAVSINSSGEYKVKSRSE